MGYCEKDIFFKLILMRLWKICDGFMDVIERKYLKLKFKMYICI